MQVSILFLTTALLSLSGASVIPAMRGPASTRTALFSSYARQGPADMNAVLEPQNFANVQSDRRKAFGESY
ncbi:hypothetical protein O1611_g3797 [Lasiodiplodia mahajangana]|uniref:Uncharacterized protein n=1 Tax=Lasiodiplodia mahajangana TaxID=1108764 RepID=A0ACC2JQR8_9PEZI|nr:hypothetical protein O1611_g3797 [Lasiodiplodia mahajangana]